MSTVDSDAFRDALARWASTVTLVAVRDGDTVHGMTVTSFVPVSADPPLVLVSLGPNARVLPFLREDTPFAISFLAAEQRRLASSYADSFPVGPSPFPAEGPPIVEGASVGLVCRVRRVMPVDETDGELRGGRLILARVEGTRTDEIDPLLYHRRRYARIRDLGG